MSPVKHNVTTQREQELQHYFLREYARHHCRIHKDPRNVHSNALRISGSTGAGVAGFKVVKDTDVLHVQPRLVRGLGGMATDSELREEDGKKVLQLRRLEPIERGTET
jgi:hypothetical protein